MPTFLDGSKEFHEARSASGEPLLVYPWFPPANRRKGLYLLGGLWLMPLVFWGGRFYFIFILIPLTYSLLAHLYNSTIFTIGADRLSWKHGPFYCRPGRSIARQELDGVAHGLVSVKHSHKLAKHKPLPQYSVGVRKQNGKTWIAFLNLPSADTAAALAQALAKLASARAVNIEMPRDSMLSTLTAVVLLAITSLVTFGLIYAIGFEALMDS
jgi:hypothetical protein